MKTSPGPLSAALRLDRVGPACRSAVRKRSFFACRAAVLAVVVTSLFGPVAVAQTYDVLTFLHGGAVSSHSSLIRGTDGSYYGTTPGGGANGYGMIFKIDASDATLTILHSFVNSDGANPYGGVVQGTDGNLYGTTYQGGANNSGTVFKIDTTGTTLTTLHSFAGNDGDLLYGGLIQGTDGDLYGTTFRGGANGYGTVFKIDTSGTTFSTLHDFIYSGGGFPRAGLTQGTDGNLYGTTAQGGTSYYGTIFKINMTGTAFTTLHSFVSSDGALPYARLTQGADGNLYGTTYYGGIACSGDLGCGTVFRIGTDGAAFATLHKFAGPDGVFPYGGLVQGPDASLYGTTASGGGAAGVGTIFKIDTSGTALTTLHDFVGDDGAYPLAGLIQGTDGNLYGTTSDGGGNNYGTIFKIDTDGTTLTTLHNFINSYGANPYAGLIQGTDGNLYGITYYGGTNNVGAIFKIDTGGTTLTTLHSFVGSDGAYPFAALIQGADGNLYGTTVYGGANGYGVVFKMDTSGTTFSILHSFSNGDGANPYGGLIQGADGQLYGTTVYGGATGKGVIFKIGINGAAFSRLHSFGGIEGANPYASLVQGTDGKLYGTTSNGGTNTFGTVFKIDTSGSTLTTLCNFFGSNGALPYAGLIQGTDGDLYGTTSQGGYGTIFKIDVSGTTLTTLHMFVSSDGSSPQASLIQAADGNLYGTTFSGGTYNKGTVFKIDTGGTTLTTLHNFAYSDGGLPSAGLIQAADGNFYGTTPSGGVGEQVGVGVGGAGVVFKMSPCSIAQSPAVSVAHCLPPNTPGQIASASGSPADAYHWTVFGGTITGGQGSQSITFTSGTAGTRLSVQVFETDANGCVGTAAEAEQVDFSDVPSGDPFQPYVCIIGRDGITAGCGGGDYCRDSTVTRAQMAVFLLKAEHGSLYIPPACTGVFPDVSCPSTFADWIEQLANEEITGGCGGGDYCPASPVTRAQMAVFLLKAEHGPSYVPSPCASIFEDVTCPGTFADWIEQLYAEQITGGCSTNPFLYCPDNPNTRGQMAVFLVKTFGLEP